MIVVVSLILQACLLAVINYLLSRHMGNWLSVLLVPPGTIPKPMQQGEPPKYHLKSYLEESLAR